MALRVKLPLGTLCCLRQPLFNFTMSGLSFIFREEKQEQLSDVSDELEEQKSLATRLRNEVYFYLLKLPP